VDYIVCLKVNCCGCTIYVPLDIGKCTPRGACTPGWEPLLLRNPFASYGRIMTSKAAIVASAGVKGSRQKTTLDV